MSQPTPLAWPTDLGFGTIVGRFVYLDGDSDDTGDDPDLIPAAGGKVTVEANAALAAYTGASPLTAVKRRVEGIIDAEGYLCRKTSSGMPGPRGLSVVATDNDSLSTTGFNYKVTVELPGAKIPPMNVSVPAGASIDLTTAVTETVSQGTKVVSLTPEIRAEIEKAVASASPTLPDNVVTTDALDLALAGVQVDTSGLATTQALADVEATIPDVVLREAALVEGESIESTRIEAIEQVDGSTALVLIQTTSTGREVTVTIPTIPASGTATSTDVLQAFTWQDLDGLSGFPSQGGWIERRGGLVTLHIRTPQTVGITAARQITGAITGATVDVPPFGDSRDPVGVQMIRADGTSSHERSRVTEWDGAYYLQPATGEDPTLDALILTWWTNGRGPISLGAAA